MKNKVFFAAILLMTGRIELHAQSDSSQKPVKPATSGKCLRMCLNEAGTFPITFRSSLDLTLRRHEKFTVSIWKIQNHSTKLAYYLYQRKKNNRD